ncbi:MAG: ATP synthase F1 subunit delta [Candidatus Aminicenantes bacterium]|nr:ATP synthase F1 subunit delta [Candidatus Aminicenantes bacterium]
MKSPVLVKRYVEGLAAALKDEAEFELVHRDIAAFAAALESHSALGTVLLRPFLATAKKEAIVRGILDAQGGSPKTRRFLLLLARHRRLDILPAVVKALPVLWRERRGVRTFEVASVVPLAQGQRTRLEAELRRVEGTDVSCVYKLDPGLVGGLLVKCGNLVYDVSLKGQLERLRSVIQER